MGSSIERISNFTFLSLGIDNIINNRYDSFRELIHVEYRRVSIHANSMKLIAILNKYKNTLITSYASSLNIKYYYSLLPYKREVFILSRQFSILAILAFAIGFLNFINSLV